MHELWDGSPHWSEEKSQAEADATAIRIITCPLKGCRRARKCRADWPSELKCPGLAAAPPKTEREKALDKVVLRHMVKRSLAEDEGDPETARIAKAARAASSARRAALAWERATAWLKERGRGG